MKKECYPKITVLVADDDEDDRLLISETFTDHCKCINLELVEDGAELLDFLKRKDIHPGIIFLDLNMPRVNGIEALEYIKHDEELKDIPVIIFTTTQEQEIIAKTYCMGASSFIKKPTGFERLSYMINIVSAYWCEIALLPERKIRCPPEKAA